MSIVPANAIQPVPDRSSSYAPSSGIVVIPLPFLVGLRLDLRRTGSEPRSPGRCECYARSHGSGGAEWTVDGGHAVQPVPQIRPPLAAPAWESRTGNGLGHA